MQALHDSRPTHVMGGPGFTVLLVGWAPSQFTKRFYIDKRELNVPCVGGDSHVPLGFVSLSENLFR